VAQTVRKNATARYAIFPRKHYAIYDEFYRDTSNRARDWFITHLK